MKKILLIEDDPDIRSNIADLLELNNYSVFSTDNGTEGVKLAAELKPDMIICDIMMPRMSGYEVKNNLMTDEVTAKIPFIFLTAKAEMDDLRKGMMMGADDYIIKPFSKDDLLKSVSVRLERFKNLKTELNSKTEKKITDKILINSNNNTQIIEIANIAYIESEGNYTNISLTSGKTISVKKLLKEWEKILPTDVFRRIHQSTIINFNLISKVERLTNRSLFIRLANIDKLFIVSQRYTQKLKDILSV